MKYEKYNQNSKSVFNNYRKRKTLKIVKTDDGELIIEIPINNNLAFQPMLIKYIKETLVGQKNLL